MQERTLDLNTAAGTMEVLIAHPGGKGPFPPVVLYMVLGAMRKLGDPMVIDDTAELLAFMDPGEPVRLGADTGDVPPAVETLSIGARPYEYPSR